MISWEATYWAIVVAGAFGSATLFAEKLLSQKTVDDVAVNVHIRDDEAWVQRFLRAFDAIFSAKNFSFRRLFSSLLATTMSIAALWVLFDPLLGLLGTRTDASMSIKILVLGLIVNFVVDFLSLAETRWILNRFRYVRSVFGHAGLLLLDLALTATMSWLALSALRTFQGGPSLHPIELVMGYSTYAIFFFSTFITSIWAWSYAAALMIVRIMSSQLVERLSEFKRPFAWLAAIVWVTVFGFLVFWEALRQNAPQDIDLRLCSQFGGILCIHVIRLSSDDEVVVSLLNHACRTPSECRKAVQMVHAYSLPNLRRLLLISCEQHGETPACASAGMLFFPNVEFGVEPGVIPRLTVRRGPYTVQGEKPDPVLAYRLLDQACREHLLHACTELGRQYIMGTSIPRDIDRAIQLLSNACARGEPNACELIPLVQGGALFRPTLPRVVPR